MALRKADRDLRLSDGASEFPVWLLPILDIAPLDQTIATSVSSFDQLIGGRHLHDEDPAIRALNDEGAFALGVLIALEGKGNPASAPYQKFGISGPPPADEILARIINGQESWWDLAYLRGINYPGTDYAVKLVDARTRYLVNNTIKARGFVVALALGGLIFLPGTLLAFLRAGKKERPINYANHWSFSFGIGTFLLAFLASIGFSLSFNIALETIGQTPGADPSQPLISMPLYVLLDSVTRFLPPLIAISLLFRRPGHAISRLGLAGPLNGRMVLGSFAMLQIIDFGLRMTLHRDNPDPLGGLSTSEDGAWGLVLGVATACLAAPIAEEILYRGVLFRTLANRLWLPAAVIISSLVFALVHFYPLSSLIIVGLVGATCALCYISSRTLLTAIALHALYNAAIKIPEWIVYHAPLS